MTSQRIPLFIYAESTLDATSPGRNAPPSKTMLQMIDDYIHARGRLGSYYVLPLQSTRDINVVAFKDTDLTERSSLRSLGVDEPIAYFGQTYYPVAWTRRKRKWRPFEYANLGLWETGSLDTNSLKTVAKGFLVGIGELIENTPLEEALVVRRVEIENFPEGSRLGLFPPAEDVYNDRRSFHRLQNRTCNVM